MTRLRATRGTKFEYDFVLGGGWVGAHFEEVVWTARTQVPDVSVLDDADAIAQAKMSTGGIAFDGATGTLLIEAATTKTWPTGILIWDMKAEVASSGAIELLDTGTLVIRGDITRSIPE